MKETRIYIINFDDLDVEFDFDIASIPDELFMDLAEQYGAVYSLKGLADAWNYDPMSCPTADATYIRFIDVPDYDCIIDILNLYGYDYQKFTIAELDLFANAVDDCYDVETVVREIARAAGKKMTDYVDNKTL